MLRQGKGPWEPGLDPCCLTLAHPVIKYIPLSGSPQPTEYLCIVGAHVWWVKSCVRYCKEQVDHSGAVPRVLSPGLGTLYNWWPSPPHDQHPHYRMTEEQCSSNWLPPVWSPWPWPDRKHFDSEPQRHGWSGRSSGLRIWTPGSESQPCHLLCDLWKSLSLSGPQVSHFFKWKH